MTLAISLFLLLMVATVLVRLSQAIKADGRGSRTPPASHTAPDRTGSWW
ncbi:hypothetical protein [Paraoerskovia marina]|uniref:Uncharacterized protein n=1 Tax=Paraoerskovia marina TaxID=545619 RepID=A0A1H1S5S6_9CELL|nr:hypothetical protein [Paraoerskovia marina]SDS43322.1 hypothetical protein SAMN04489860_1540 [Paraoerskovia marina]